MAFWALKLKSTPTESQRLSGKLGSSGGVHYEEKRPPEGSAVASDSASVGVAVATLPHQTCFVLELLSGLFFY